MPKQRAQPLEMTIEMQHVESRGASGDGNRVVRERQAAGAVRLLACQLAHGREKVALRRVVYADLA